MAIGIQDQYFGTEIEMTGITRQRGCRSSGRIVEHAQFMKVDTIKHGL